MEAYKKEFNNNFSYTKKNCADAALFTLDFFQKGAGYGRNFIKAVKIGYLLVSCAAFIACIVLATISKTLPGLTFEYAGMAICLYLSVLLPVLPRYLHSFRSERAVFFAYLRE